ncbi:hypothetical protein BHM03_00008332 [Ensete ventricosum]|nr:hypothetical protein BHM03_00008332 [Ensete ventricosum]
MAQALRLLSPTTFNPSVSKFSVTASTGRPLPSLPRRLPRALRASASLPPPDLGLIYSDGGAGAGAAIDVDAVTEAEMKENGFRSTRRTKLVCTIGPATCSAEQLEALAVGGMNVARVNMCHGTREWHRQVIRQLRRLNEEKGFAVAVMMDTEGSEIHMGDLGGTSSAKAEIESIDSLKNLEDIVLASDGAMVARGDMGAQIPLEEVPSAQQKIVKLCRQLNKPVIVASQLLESMIEYPTPTRAEVADVSEAVKQRADALMLSGESAMGQYPEKALTVLRSVSLRIERWWREEKRHEAMELPDIASSFSDKISEEICNSAAKMG